MYNLLSDIEIPIYLLRPANKNISGNLCTRANDIFICFHNNY